MSTTSVRMTALRKATDSQSVSNLADALKKLCTLEDSVDAKRKIGFDQTVTLTARLGVDVKQADQQVRGAVVLPNGTGRKVRVLVFCQAANVAIAKEAGADFVGGPELAAKVKEGWMDFDVAIATPDMMGVVGPLGKVLGPRGLMPSPRAGTVTQDVANTVREYKAGKVEFRVDAGGNVHCVVGKMSFTPEQLSENIEALLKYLRSLKPASSKGVYIRNVTVSATFSPGINIAA